MLWVIVFVSIAVAGLIMAVCYGVWLAHKTADVLSEVNVLADRGAQLGELLGQIGAPATELGSNPTTYVTTPGVPVVQPDRDVR